MAKSANKTSTKKNGCTEVAKGMVIPTWLRNEIGFSINIYRDGYSLKKAHVIDGRWHDCPWALRVFQQISLRTNGFKDICPWAKNGAHGQKKFR